MSIPALDAALELLDEICSPEIFGHAIPQDLRTRAYVIRSMLERMRHREIDEWKKREGQDVWLG